MKYILFVFFYMGNSPTTAVHAFDSQKACLNARAAILQTSAGQSRFTEAICVPYQ